MSQEPARAWRPSIIPEVLLGPVLLHPERTSASLWGLGGCVSLGPVRCCLVFPKRYVGMLAPGTSEVTMWRQVLYGDDQVTVSSLGWP